MANKSFGGGQVCLRFEISSLVALSLTSVCLAIYFLFFILLFYVFGFENENEKKKMIWKKRQETVRIALEVRTE